MKWWHHLRPLVYDPMGRLTYNERIRATVIMAVGGAAIIMLAFLWEFLRGVS